MRVNVEQDNKALSVYISVEADEPLNATKALRGVMGIGYFTNSTNIMVIVYCPIINKNVSDFLLDLSTVLTRYGVNREGSLELGLYVVPKNDIGLTALLVSKTGYTNKLDVVIYTRNVEIDTVFSDNENINNQIWVNALTADESITMEEIHARHPSLVESVAFIDVSNLEAKDIAYLKRQVTPMVFVDSKSTEDYTVSESKAYACVTPCRATSKIFLRDELTGVAIKDTVYRVMSNILITNVEPIPVVTDGILTSERDVHFTITIDKKGNKSLEIDFGKVANIISDISFVNDKLGCMKSVVKTTLSRMYPSYNWGVRTKDGKLVITGPGMKSATLVPGVDPSKQQIEYVLSRTVYFTMVLGRYLKGEIDSVDMDSGSADREKWYQNNIKYIMQ